MIIVTERRLLVLWYGTVAADESAGRGVQDEEMTHPRQAAGGYIYKSLVSLERDRYALLVL